MIALMTLAQLFFIFSLSLLFLACDPLCVPVEVEARPIKATHIAPIPITGYGRPSILQHLPKGNKNG